MSTLASTDFLAIIALCFAIYVAKRNVVINREKNRIYIGAVATTIILLILENVTIFLGQSTSVKLVIPYRLANVLGFSLSPAISFLILLFVKANTERNKLYRYMLPIPLIINVLICILSYKGGLVFFVDTHNQYTRGRLFLVPTITSMIYYVLCAIIVMRSSIEYEMEDKKFIFTIYLIPVFGTVVQILFKDVLLIWSCISITLLLFYYFMLELQFRYDIQTKIKNRTAFEKEMQQYDNNNMNAIVVVFDLNNLKEINDQYGHNVGDEMIFQAATRIKENFRGIGTAYRIGGDEFCVICKDASKEAVDHKLSNLDNLFFKIDPKKKIKISLAYGYALYNKEETGSIYTALNKADKAMYSNKIKIKGYYGRRSDDYS